MTILIEPHYLPSLEFMAILSQTEKVCFDLKSKFRKQTYRNRACILSSNGAKVLSIPVHHNSQSTMADVEIDYSQSWVKDHWGAFYSSYGKAAFFDYLADEFKAVWNRDRKYLHELNSDMLSVCLKILRWDIKIVEEVDDDVLDLRDQLSPKIDWKNRNYYRPVEYFQNFGNTFVPNLSILDLLLCQGPEASQILKDSIATPIERFV